MKYARLTAVFLVLCGWSVVSIYTGAASFMAVKAFEDASQRASSDGSYDYRGINFANSNELGNFVRQERLGTWFPWIPEVPIELVPLLLAASFAAFGGVMAIVKLVAVDQLPLEQTPFVSLPLFALAVGVMLFFLSFLVPAVFTTGRGAPRTETVAGISLFGGLFAERTFVWIDAQIRQFFRSRRQTRGKHK